KDVANVQPPEEQPVSQALVSSDNNKITEQVGSSIKASGESFVDKGIVSGNESVEKQSKAPKKTRKKKETAPKETKPKKASTKKGKRIKN
ncbi:MAG: hypothetical protein ACP5RS_02160, partial [Thermoplasmata archaeon]